MLEFDIVKIKKAKYIINTKITKYDIQEQKPLSEPNP